ncbi:hypothetical protein JH298_21570 (plasmid) [Xanthomonas campestris pv. campestris]|uniref:hypothetical protein n=1 Tax=Xanthomonas campestris TaxID=339 RepID=UPI0020C962FE|nr:hypothetical protein [Xanthomonas campestris]MDM7718742.1 hypothetical protein [Xanthomonas campestris pv. campestris]MEA0953372.1 hypothetical protein [Xanthomonas campestris pv. campestris]MEB1105714.1 hypothetical protein [Xanthomonas campestris pv. campestris]MEB1624105.1 hypothetical protein [Xanthomonas campestris pv. campestris]WDJ74884.1 hypothetical protein JH298_21570 [Xanthomonas campestris pv. campestris]
MNYPIYTPLELFGASLSQANPAPADFQLASEFLWDAQVTRVVPVESPQSAARHFLDRNLLIHAIKGAWGNSADMQLRQQAQSYDENLATKIHAVYVAASALSTAPGSQHFPSRAAYLAIC